MIRRFSSFLFTGILTLSVCSMVPAADAKDSKSFFGAQGGLFAISDSRERTFLDAGTAFVSRAPYVGSEDNETRVLPFARADYKGRLFINPTHGAGVYWRHTENMRLSTSLNYSVGRDGEDTPLIGEAGDITSSLAMTNALRYYLPFAAFDAIATIPFTGDFDGTRFDTLLTTEIKPFKGLRLTPGVRATFGTAGWAGTLYNIDAEIANNITGVESFDAGGGLMALGAHTAAYYELPNDFQLIGVLNYSVLQEDAKDSPLSIDNSGLTFALGLARHF